MCLGFLLSTIFIAEYLNTRCWSGSQGHTARWLRANADQIRQEVFPLNPTVGGRDAAIEPPGLGLRRVGEREPSCFFLK